MKRLLLASILLVPMSDTRVQVQTAVPTTQAPSPVPTTQASSPPSCPELATALTAVVRNDARLQDWPNLTRYREANHGLAAPAPSERRVVFMGDSITDIWQQPRFGFFAEPSYVDRGISGQTTPQMLLRFHDDVIALKPKVVVILGGTNDIAANTGPMTNEDIEANLESMSELAHGHGIRVVLSSVTPVSAYHRTPGDTRAPQTSLRPMDRIRAINDWMKAYAGSHGDVYLDYFSAMVDPSGVLREELSADDLHPTPAGYAVMAPLAQAALEKALR